MAVRCYPVQPWLSGVALVIISPLGQVALIIVSPCGNVRKGPIGPLRPNGSVPKGPIIVGPLGHFGAPFREARCFGATLRSLRHHFWHVKATLESLFAYDDDFVATLGSFCVHIWHVRAALGAFGRHFGVTLGALAAYGNDFGVTLGSFWGQFGYLWVTLRHLMVCLLYTSPSPRD